MANLSLLDPFEQNFPEAVETYLQSGQALTLAFNRRGTMLAAGRADGHCVVWDFDTRSVARDLAGHSAPVRSVSWSRSGRRLVTGGLDGRCVVWDLLRQDGTDAPGSRIEVPFTSAILQVAMHPRRKLDFVVCPAQEAPVYVSVRLNAAGEPTVTKTPFAYPASDPAAAAAAAATATDGAVAAAVIQPSPPCVVAFDANGQRLYMGDRLGYLFICDVGDHTIRHCMRVQANAPIRTVRYSPARKGSPSGLLINAKERLRVYRLDNAGLPSLEHEFKDDVNRCTWRQACFSYDGELVVGGFGEQQKHSIYIWDRHMTNLVKILEGPKEPLEDLTWHPLRPVIASTDAYGRIVIWAIGYQEKWSAYAPDFKELEENVEYEEREDEFDLVPDNGTAPKRSTDTDEVVDVITVDGADPLEEDRADAGDDSEDEVLFLPAIIEDDPTAAVAAAVAAVTTVAGAADSDTTSPMAKGQPRGQATRSGRVPREPGAAGATTTPRSASAGGTGMEVDDVPVRVIDHSVVALDVSPAKKRKRTEPPAADTAAVVVTSD